MSLEERGESFDDTGDDTGDDGELRPQTMAKLFTLADDGSWMEIGVGVASVEAASGPIAAANGGGGGMRLIIRSMEEQEETLLDTPVSSDDIYACQRDTILVWSDPEVGRDMAASFNDARGLTVVYDAIRQFQESARHRGDLIAGAAVGPHHGHHGQPPRPGGAFDPCGPDPDSHGTGASTSGAAAAYGSGANAAGGSGRPSTGGQPAPWAVVRENLPALVYAADANRHRFGVYVRDSPEFFKELSAVFRACRACGDSVGVQHIANLTLMLLNPPYNSENYILGQLIAEEIIDATIDIVQCALGRDTPARGFVDVAGRRGAFRSAGGALPPQLVERAHYLHSLQYLRDLVPLLLEDGDAMSTTPFSMFVLRLRFTLCRDVLEDTELFARCLAPPPSAAIAAAAAAAAAALAETPLPAPPMGQAAAAGWTTAAAMEAAEKAAEVAVQPPEGANNNIDDNKENERPVEPPRDATAAAAASSADPSTLEVDEDQSRSGSGEATTATTEEQQHQHPQIVPPPPPEGEDGPEPLHLPPPRTGATTPPPPPQPTAVAAATVVPPALALLPLVHELATVVKNSVVPLEPKEEIFGLFVVRGVVPFLSAALRSALEGPGRPTDVLRCADIAAHAAIFVPNKFRGALIAEAAALAGAGAKTSAESATPPTAERGPDAELEGQPFLSLLLIALTRVRHGPTLHALHDCCSGLAVGLAAQSAMLPFLTTDLAPLKQAVVRYWATGSAEVLDARGSFGGGGSGRDSVPPSSPLAAVSPVLAHSPGPGGASPAALAAAGDDAAAAPVAPVVVGAAATVEPTVAPASSVEGDAPPTPTTGASSDADADAEGDAGVRASAAAVAAAAAGATPVCSAPTTPGPNASPLGRMCRAVSCGAFPAATTDNNNISNETLFHCLRVLTLLAGPDVLSPAVAAVLAASGVVQRAGRVAAGDVGDAPANTTAATTATAAAAVAVAAEAAPSPVPSVSAAATGVSAQHSPAAGTAPPTTITTATMADVAPGTTPATTATTVFPPVTVAVGRHCVRLRCQALALLSLLSTCRFPVVHRAIIAADALGPPAALFASLFARGSQRRNSILAGAVASVFTAVVRRAEAAAPAPTAPASLACGTPVSESGGRGGGDRRPALCGSFGSFDALRFALGRGGGGGGVGGGGRGGLRASGSGDGGAAVASTAAEEAAVAVYVAARHGAAMAAANARLATRLASAVRRISAASAGNAGGSGVNGGGTAGNGNDSGAADDAASSAATASLGAFGEDSADFSGSTAAVDRRAIDAEFEALLEHFNAPDSPPLGPGNASRRGAPPATAVSAASATAASGGSLPLPQPLPLSPSAAGSGVVGVSVGGEAAIGGFAPAFSSAADDADDAVAGSGGGGVLPLPLPQGLRRLRRQRQRRGTADGGGGGAVPTPPHALGGDDTDSDGEDAFLADADDGGALTGLTRQTSFYRNASGDGGGGVGVPPPLPAPTAALEPPPAFGAAAGGAVPARVPSLRKRGRDADDDGGASSDDCTARPPQSPRTEAEAAA